MPLRRGQRTIIGRSIDPQPRFIGN
jgi:hypothetical protein